MSLSFPSSIRLPLTGWKLQPEDNVLRSETTDGFVISRPRYTRARLKITGLKWELPASEAVIFWQFFNVTTVCGVLPFSYSSLLGIDGTMAALQFTEPPDFSYLGIFDGLRVFEITAVMREV